MTIRTILRRGLAGAGLAALLALPASASPCDPSATTLDRAEHLNKAGEFDAALALVNPIAAKSPHYFRASYVQGMILFDKAAATDRNQWNPPLPFSKNMAEAFRILTSAADQIEHMDDECLRDGTPYDILNTIGAFYLNRGYFAQSQDYLLRAYANKDKLNKDTQRKVLDNLGLVYMVQRKPDLAIRYYSEASTLGSAVAARQIPNANTLKRALAAPAAVPLAPPPR